MELVYLSIAIIVIILFIYREITRKKKEREYFPEDFKKEDSKNKKNTNL